MSFKNSSAALPSIVFSFGSERRMGPHGFSRRREKMSAVLPIRLVRRADESQIRLVDEGRGLKGLVGRLGCHAHGGELPQLVVDEWQQVSGRLPIPGRIEEARHIGRIAECNRTPLAKSLKMAGVSSMADEGEGHSNQRKAAKTASFAVISPVVCVLRNGKRHTGL